MLRKNRRAFARRFFLSPLLIRTKQLLILPQDALVSSQLLVFENRGSFFLAEKVIFLRYSKGLLGIFFSKARSFLMSQTIEGSPQLLVFRLVYKQRAENQRFGQVSEKWCVCLENNFRFSSLNMVQSLATYFVVCHHGCCASHEMCSFRKSKN